MHDPATHHNCVMVRDVRCRGPDRCDLLYFRKAFDTVPHKWLLRKLEAYGIKGDILTWIKNFLSGRRQRVVVGSRGKSGIPQGSVLGPILFVIFINDLPDEVMCTAKIFADDTKLSHSINSLEDRVLLQDDLNRLVECSRQWQMGFNESKVLYIGSSNQCYEYRMNSTSLEPTTDEKDLGVTIDQDLTFHLHVSKAVHKASKMQHSPSSTSWHCQNCYKHGASTSGVHECDLIS